MKPIIYIILIIISWGLLAFEFLMSRRKIKNQGKYINQLIREKSKMSDKLRLKGIEVDRLVKRIKKAENNFNIRIVG